VHIQVSGFLAVLYDFLIFQEQEQSVHNCLGVILKLENFETVTTLNKTAIEGEICSHVHRCVFVKLLLLFLCDVHKLFHKKYVKPFLPYSLKHLPSGVLIIFCARKYKSAVQFHDLRLRSSIYIFLFGGTFYFCITQPRSDRVYAKFHNNEWLI
jgi:hypothetical protein